MERHFSGLSPGCPPEQQGRLQDVIAFWNALSCESDAGETTWGVLEGLQAQVTECLGKVPPDLTRAESLTALAALLMTGKMRS
jgi:hypothetical protein